MNVEPKAVVRMGGMTTSNLDGNKPCDCLSFAENEMMFFLVLIVERISVV